MTSASSHKLGEIALVQQGYTFKPEYQGQSSGKWVYAKVADLSASGSSKYLRRSINYISDTVLQAIGAKPFPAGSIVFPRVGAALRNNNKRLLAQDSLTDDNVLVITVRNTEICSPEYLYYWFDFRDLQDFCNDGTVPVINGRNLKQQRVLLPNIQTQRKTAEMLDAWDKSIELVQRLVAAKEQRFSALLGRLITSQTNSTSWRQAPIRQIAERIQRQSDGSGYPLLTIASASGFIPQEEKYSRYMAGESAKTYTLLRAGEFSYNKGNSKRYEFGCVFQLQEHEAALVPSVYVSFRLHDSVCAAYLRHLFSADYLKPQLRALVKTGVRNNGLLNIRPDEFMGTTVPLPPLQEQKRIADILDTSRQEITLLFKQLEALKTQKRGLMQKLLTGQWRFNTATVRD